MIDVYSQGSQVGVVLSGVSGFLLITYIVLELVFLSLTGSFLFHKLFLWHRVRKELNKIIPKWWKVYSVNPLTIQRKSGGFEVYVKVVSRINGSWTNDHIKVNWWGKVLDETLTKAIAFEDRSMDSEIKSWQRNKALEDIGI